MKIKRMTIDLDAEIHAKLKSVCAINKLSIKEVLTEKILEFINEMSYQTKTTNNVKED